MKYISEQEIDKLSGNFGKALKKEKKVALIIGKEKGSEYWEGGINGHFIRIKRGEMVEVPESIAKLIRLSEETIEQGAAMVAEYVNGSKKVG